jgi:MFS family permease
MKWLKLKSFSEHEIKQSFELLRQYDTGASSHTRKDDAREDGQRINIIKCIHGLQRANHHSKVTSSADDKRLRILRLLIGKNYIAAASITNQSSMAMTPSASSPPSTNTGIELGSDDDNDNDDDDNIYPLTYEQYKEKIVRIGETLDIRIWNIGLSFLFAGASVGIIVPCMPLLVSQLSIPPNEFGYIVSAFGLSKLLGNIPAGYLVDTYGRKPVMVAGLGMCAIGMGSIGFALMPGLGTPWLISCRLVSGLGVSAFVAGGFMYMSDISNALNRTRTIAPVMAAFSAGAALGPAVGGLLVDTIGIPSTYGIVGGLFVLLAVVNSKLLEETKAQVLVHSTDSSEELLHDGSSEVEKDKDKDRGIMGSFHTAYSSWYELINSSNRQISNVVVLNGLYWFTLSGTQMTLLPLVMINPHFGLQLSAYEIGGCFAFMSIISFASSQPLAYLSDKYGKVPLMLIGCTMLSGSMFSLPLLASMDSTSMDLLPILLPFALGSTIMNSNPNALMANETTSESRSQGLSLLRTSGDLGLLLGSTASGAFALMTSIESALQMNGLVTSATIIWFTSRNWKHLSFKI